MVPAAGLRVTLPVLVSEVSKSGAKKTAKSTSMELSELVDIRGQSSAQLTAKFWHSTATPLRSAMRRR